MLPLLLGPPNSASKMSAMFCARIFYLIFCFFLCFFLLFYENLIVFKHISLKYKNKKNYIKKKWGNAINSTIKSIWLFCKLFAAIVYDC